MTFWLGSFESGLGSVSMLPKSSIQRSTDSESSEEDVEDIRCLRWTLSDIDSDSVSSSLESRGRSGRSSVTASRPIATVSGAAYVVLQSADAHRKRIVVVRIVV